ncbi:uroporphyrinogen-III C-methyltransferase [Segnochrobactrum spirostomi]|uniref:uroporphyrinogen-III C-methyltransferase n=1 Tax=Segnochrobactrum spirostomi TaxID=2608987 RepID=A0A6A7Y5R0_9HYPH|nr:uroporphyrinogen-III C-methyltransferase [Segnochrobactrum spirostomi]MQT13421.1 uroporphyrinogen-III C-methyltransferase [Segnochrobactrum spirostomi]
MSADAALAALIASVPDFVPGSVWLAGAGPGDPRFLTAEAIAGLVRADVVVHDALVSDGVLALAGPQAVLEFAGKRGGKPSAAQDDISARLVVLAREGKRVLRLKGGDPFVFGRGGEEAVVLAREAIPYRVLPGLTAGLVALSSASIPATMRGTNQALVLANGHGGAGPDGLDWAALAATGQPIVLYMAMATLREIAGALQAGGLAPTTPAAVIASAGTPQERAVFSTLANVSRDTTLAGILPPAIVVIGHIVSLRGRLLPPLDVEPSR